MIKRAFTEHPASVGETYFEHMGMAFGFGSRMVLAGLACLIHGFLPFLFTRTGRDCIQELHFRMVTHRDKRTHDAAKPLDALQAKANTLEAAE